VIGDSCGYDLQVAGSSPGFEGLLGLGSDIQFVMGWEAKSNGLPVEEALDGT
jgi:hypothetical protein